MKAHIVLGAACIASATLAVLGEQGERSITNPNSVPVTRRAPTTSTVVDGVTVPGAEVPASAPAPPRLPAAAPRAGRPGQQVDAPVLINFDTDAAGAPLVAPCFFDETTALRELYAPLGVHFTGGAPLDGGAILDECGNFGVPALSTPNFLAFNPGGPMMDGGIPQPPQIITFDAPPSTVSIWAAGGLNTGSTVLMEAFDTGGGLVDSDTVSSQDWNQLTVAWPAGIGSVRLTQTGSDSAWVLDDLTFKPGDSNRCFDQPPAPDFGPFSDIDCDNVFCNNPIQVLAENFVLTQSRSIDSLRFWGLYFDGVAPQFDRFTVVFWTDAGGLPGSIINKMGPRPATTREATGNTAFGFPEYEYTIDLEPNKDLEPGTYWVEIYNDTSACPWDCDPAGPDGIVGITDFLGLLAQWGSIGTTCDFNADGVGIIDFLKLLAHWGPCPVTADAWIWEDGLVDPVNGIPGIAFSFVRNNQEQWQAFGLDLALNLTCKPNPFGCPGEGDCCLPNGTPGCDNRDCCRRVCETDPFCCDNEWDQLCADGALQFPQCECAFCTNDCGTGNLPEGEPCLVDGDVDTTNGGCNSTPPVYGFASCGDTVCGIASTFVEARDTDWYCVDLPDPDGDGVEELRATLSSEFNGVCFIIGDGGCPDGAGCAPLVVGQPGSSVNCDPTGDAAACLPAPGTYVVFVATADFTGAPCIEGANDYTVSITCNPCPPGAQPSPALDAETSAKLLAPTAE